MKVGDPEGRGELRFMRVNGLQGAAGTADDVPVTKKFIRLVDRESV